MSLRLQRWLVVGAIILGMGAHWAILQSVAWTGMVISFSQHASFREALEKTFDGKHLCTLCKTIRAGRESERSQDQQKLALKLDPFVKDIATSRLFPPALAKLAVFLPRGHFRSKDAPPTPPPAA